MVGSFESAAVPLHSRSLRRLKYAGVRDDAVEGANQKFQTQAQVIGRRIPALGFFARMCGRSERRGSKIELLISGGVKLL